MSSYMFNPIAGWILFFSLISCIAYLSFTIISRFLPNVLGTIVTRQGVVPITLLFSTTSAPAGSLFTYTSFVFLLKRVAQEESNTRRKTAQDIFLVLKENLLSSFGRIVLIGYLQVM